METAVIYRGAKRNGRIMRCWTAMVLLVLYAPMLALVAASFSKSKFFNFPVKTWSASWYEAAVSSLAIHDALSTSLIIAALVTVVSVILGIFGALAFARYGWKGRTVFQKIILLPIFFPQAVLGLAMLLWFSALGIMPSWQTAAFAHIVWIVPVVTLIIAIQVYGFDSALEEAAYDLGASRLQVFFQITLPILWPAIFSGALFAFLLSWSNFPLTNYTSGVDTTIPRWLYAKMMAGYTPQVPVVSTLAMLAAAVILLGGYLLLKYRRLRRSKITRVVVYGKEL
jgi:spermidine/putrescine transport system permease protein